MCNLSGERWRKYQPYRLPSLSEETLKEDHEDHGDSTPIWTKERLKPG